MSDDAIGLVVIGRNEGERLRRCFLSLKEVHYKVYVDSGSVDGSVALAGQMGFDVVELSAPPGFTAARARNAGFHHLLDRRPDLAFVQMVDGDCEMASGWLSAASRSLAGDPTLAAVFGRCRERYPDASLYNRICDDEWNVPVGEARSCGGNAMFRAAALSEAGGYTLDLIAGEEPDLCLRLRQSGWRIFRIDAEMVVHDAAMTRLSQWWKRSRRSGHAFTELSHRHGRRADPKWLRQVASILLWGTADVLGIAAPLAALIAQEPAILLVTALVAIANIAQICRLAFGRIRKGYPVRHTLPWAALTMLGKLSQLQGLAGFWMGVLTRRRTQLIEYRSQPVPK